MFLESVAAVIELGPANQGKPGLATFTADVYDGGPMFPRITGADTGGAPLIIDIAAVHVVHYGRKTPVLYAHDRKDPIGHTTRVTLFRDRITATGILSAPGPSRDRVIGAAQSGFRWAVSVGFEATELQRLAAGKVTTVNQRRIEGPGYIARRGTLREISLLTIGADPSATAKVAGAGGPA